VCYCAGMKRAVIYARISQDQSGERAGVERQEHACRGLAQARGWDVVAVEVDNSISASTGKVRPAWQRVLGMIEQGEVDVVLTWHLDRITRTMIELEELITLSQAHGVGVATATGDIDLTTDTGQMVARILAAVARAEVDRKAARQRAAHDQRAQQGRSFWTNRPFGYNRDGTHHPVEAPAVIEAYRDVIAGRAGAYAISQRWNEAGLLSTLGNQWRASAVTGFLTNPRNMGVLELRGETVGPGNWMPLVDGEMFAAAKRLLHDPSRKTSYDGRRKALLTGIATCGVCGSALVQGQSSPRKDGSRYRLYWCRSSRRCVTVPADWLDSYVTRKVIDRADQWISELPTQGALDGGELDALRLERAAKEQTLATLADLFVDGELTREQFTAQNRKLIAQVAELEQQLVAAVAAGMSLDPADLEAIWEQTGDPEVLRGVMLKTVTRLRLLPRGKGNRRPSGEHVDLGLAGNANKPPTQ